MHLDYEAGVISCHRTRIDHGTAVWAEAHSLSLSYLDVVYLQLHSDPTLRLGEYFLVGDVLRGGV